MDKNLIYKRLLALLLSVAVGVTFIPLLGGSAYAKDSNGKSEEKTRAFVVNDDGTETEISEEELAELKAGSVSEMPPEDIDVIMADELDEDDALGSDADADDEDVSDLPDISYDADDPEDAYYEDPDAVYAEDSDENDADTDDEDPDQDMDDEDPAAYESSDYMTGIGDAIPEYYEDTLTAHSVETAEVEAAAVDPSQYSVKIDQSGNTISLSGTINSPYYFANVFVDDADHMVGTVMSTRVSGSIDLSSFGTGYHTVFMSIAEGNTIVDIIWKQYVKVNTITAKPNYKGNYEVYSKYFNIYPFGMGQNTSGGKLYLEYKTSKAKKWKRSGYMEANMIQLLPSQGYKISGLKAKKKYKTRLRYGTVVTYNAAVGGDGKDYFFGGPTLKSKTIKTGASKKPKIKSVRAKATHVKYHKIKHYGYYTGVYLYTEKFYTYKVKVIVRLKKKPGTKGLFINGVWRKGNKKYYTKTFAPYPNYSAKHPRHRIKFTVTIRSGQSKSYGGYSPKYKKTKKLS